MPPKSKVKKKVKEQQPFKEQANGKCKGNSSYHSKRYNLRQKGPSHLNEEAYDADSEGDLNYDSVQSQGSDGLSSDSEMHEEVRCLEAMTVDETENGQTQLDKRQPLSSANVSQRQTLLKSLFNKENVTPPDMHSTPTLNTSQKHDESLFGFNTLDSPLPFSPVIGELGKMPNPPPPSPASSCLSQPSSVASSMSPVKRKIGFSVYDSKIEIPKKKRKKPLKTSKEKASDKDGCLEALRKEFQEIEMHQLAIE